MGDSTVSSAIRIFPALSCACELERGEGKEQDGCFASMRSAGTTVSSAVRKQFCTSAQLSIKRVDLSSLVHVSEVIDHQWGACSLEEKLLDLILQILVCVFCFVLKSLSTWNPCTKRGWIQNRVRASEILSSTVAVTLLLCVLARSFGPCWELWPLPLCNIQTHTCISPCFILFFPWAFWAGSKSWAEIQRLGWSCTWQTHTYRKLKLLAVTPTNFLRVLPQLFALTQWDWVSCGFPSLYTWSKRSGFWLSRVLWQMER